MTAWTNAVAEPIRPHARLRKKPLRGAVGRLKRDLAGARAELARLDEAHAARIRHEAATARDIRYRQAIDQLDRDYRRWKRAPDLFRDALGATWQGALVLARIWAAMVNALEPCSLELNLELVCQVMMANGSPWKVHQATPEGWWIMSRYLVEQHEREEKTALWIKKSRDLEPLLHQQRAEQQVLEVIVAGDPGEELRTRAREQAAHWAAEAERLAAVFEAEVALAAQTLAGTGLGDRTLTQEARLLMAQRKTARDYCQKLEKRLDALRRNRHSQAALKSTHPPANQQPANEKPPIPAHVPDTKISKAVLDRQQTPANPQRPQPTLLTAEESAMLARMYIEMQQPVQPEELTSAMKHLAGSAATHQPSLLIRA